MILTVLMVCAAAGLFVLVSVLFWAEIAQKEELRQLREQVERLRAASEPYPRRWE